MSFVATKWEKSVYNTGYQENANQITQDHLDLELNRPFFQFHSFFGRKSRKEDTKEDEKIKTMN